MCNPGKQFEQEVVAAAVLMGHKILEKPKPGADGGIDAMTELKNMPFGGGRFIIQCKDEPTRKIGRQVVDQLIGTLERKGIATGIIVTTGTFAITAQKAARASGRIELINGKQWNDIRKKLMSPLELTVAWARRTKKNNNMFVGG